MRKSFFTSTVSKGALVANFALAFSTTLLARHFDFQLVAVSISAAFAI